MSKSLEELKDLFSNFDGNLQAEFIEQFPEIWDDCYDIEMGSRYHRLMTSCMLAGWFSAIKAVSEREKTINEKEIVDIITEWKHFWMNQTQNNKQDYENYFRRASGIDANMKYNLAKRIIEALKDYRGMK